MSLHQPIFHFKILHSLPPSPLSPPPSLPPSLPSLSLFIYLPPSLPLSPLSPPKVHDLSSEEDDHEEGEFTIEEEHEATDSEEEEEDSGEDLYSSLTADVLHSLALSPRRSGESILGARNVGYKRHSTDKIHSFVYSSVALDHNAGYHGTHNILHLNTSSRRGKNYLMHTVSH